ncbi:hypothetical protein [Amycolatopsis anabasis]|uniref:hypothetical protein n=1 Tax=Amycolatopsis anabasis TaxID=1840409 RepID=UPI00131BB118|nr:hypothetical protein [Amycolatopsis anabasis]
MTEPVTPSTSLTDEWLGMRVLEHVRELHKANPETADRVLQMVDNRLRQRRETEETQQRHRCRLEWAWFAFRVFMALLGLSALIIFALVAVRFLEHGAPMQASIALGTGAVSVVAIFVTGRAAGPLFSRQDQEQKPQP